MAVQQSTIPAVFTPLTGVGTANSGKIMSCTDTRTTRTPCFRMTGVSKLRGTTAGIKTVITDLGVIQRTSIDGGNTAIL